jgi:uncharacterized LabA/DUF88 family protein
MIRVAVFVDGSNMMGQLKALQRRPNFPALLPHLATAEEGRYLQEAQVYLPLPNENPESCARFHDWLRHQGFVVVSKRAKQLPNGASKCDLDGELLLDALEYAMTVKPDVLVLATGDGDCATLARRLRARGIRVEVASLSACLASELKAACNGWIDLSAWVNECEAMSADAPVLGTDDIFDEAIN